MKKNKHNEFIIHDDFAEIIIKHKNSIVKVKIDLEDVDKVREIGSWHALFDKTLQVPSYYICHRKQNHKCYKLHRYIMDCPEGMEVDHINHDTLDNRKSNLKICTRWENQQNLRSKVTTQTGVYYRNRDNCWVSNITKNKKRYSKQFKTIEEAVSWRKIKEIELYRKEVA